MTDPNRTQPERPAIHGCLVRPVRIRPLLGPDLSSADGRVDWVVVDQLLRGVCVPYNRWELRAALGWLYELRQQHHGGAPVLPGRRFNDRSPYLQIRYLLSEALGVTYAQMQVHIDRYNDARTLAARRAARKKDS